ncbi:class I adenylate-forming enzyme family protein [Thalassobacillus sp. C254]|uniref:class I adenylate-forming enzyme family protein n=1 Tax=Thalassobacillus sp. C254 TaxID=1225341 RepID=UPI0006D21EFB|nr:fatty acid--CoA ligase family protein [Thalassobacillus sp. C254]
MKDNDGFIYILDRKKDMINRAGEKVFSIEVEDVLKAHPDILDAAVIGVPDSILGEKVKAFLVSSGPNKLQNETIQEYCRSQLAKFKVPEDIEWVKELPRNASGKILKQNLKTKENSTI